MVDSGGVADNGWIVMGRMGRMGPVVFPHSGKAKGLGGTKINRSSARGGKGKSITTAPLMHVVGHWAN